MSASVLMYTTAVCPYCIRAKQLLKSRGVNEIEEVRIDLDPQRRDEMMQKTQRRTVPQIFIGETHVGGCDDLIAIDKAGKLDAAARRRRLKTDSPTERESWNKTHSRFSVSRSSTSRIFPSKCPMHRKSSSSARRRRSRFN